MMKHNGEQRSPEQIQAEIERTRGELDRTLNAIERRLTPGQLLDQGLDYLKRSGAKEYADHLGDSIKSDPLPLALVGVGLAWLMVSDRGRTRHVERRSAGEVADAIEERVGQTTQRMSDAAHAARERAGRMAQSAREQAEKVRGGYEHLVNEQPLALGAIGFAVGALLAATTPRTRLEERIAGADEDRIDAARDAAVDAAPESALVDPAGSVEAGRPPLP